MSDKDIRGWILNDPFLYDLAREYGKGGDDEMYESIYDFISINRNQLIEYIQILRNKSKNQQNQVGQMQQILANIRMGLTNVRNSS